ncbi:hypothetical protein D3C72_2575560 [compost metagenome]
MPNTDQKIAAQTSACGMLPISGSSVMFSPSLNSTGRKAISVMTELTRLTPSASTVEENRIVSS